MSALKTALRHLRSERVSPKALIGTSPPPELIAAVLNSRGVREHRLRVRDKNYRIHVSDLLKYEKSEEFCPREHALKFFDDREHTVHSMAPGLALLFTTGHAYHDHVRNEWMRWSPHADKAWGSWRCRCGRTVRIGCHRPRKLRANHCKVCRTHIGEYVEFDVFLPKYRLVGHPDFIVKWGDRYYIYEIKTIDRVDVDFEALDAPLGDHTLQASFYYWMMRALGFKVSPAIRYIYLDRAVRKMFGGQVYKEFTQKVSDRKRLEPFLEKAQTLRKSLESGVLPPRICPKFNCSRAKNCKEVVACFNRKNNHVFAKSAQPA